MEPQSLHRPLKPSQQCFQQPEPHFVTSAGVREPGKKNWGGVVLSSSTFDESNILLWISVPKNCFLTLVNDISRDRDRNYFIDATILISSLSYDRRLDRSYKLSKIVLIQRSLSYFTGKIFTIWVCFGGSCGHSGIKTEYSHFNFPLWFWFFWVGS